MITLDDISLQRGSKILLTHASVQMHRGQRLGLTGPNGCGKTSLLMLISGELEIDDGTLALQPGIEMATVAQEIEASEQAAIEYVLDGDRALRECQEALAAASDDQLAGLHQRMEELDGYTANARAARLLSGLGFSEAQLQHSLNQFSGGWRVRLNLARALMCPSDVLLLDEPTNHLDLEAVLWLELWLSSYPGLLILISHDREFLDAVTTHILSVESAELIRYRGNYSAFEQQRAARLAQQQSAYEKQQREISHMQSYIERFRAKATKARQAQSRLKALARMQEIAPAYVDSQFSFAFKEAPRASDPLFNIEKVSVGYNDTPILEQLELQIRPGQRIGLLGPNGAGKSTMIKMLAQELSPMKGECSPAKGLRIGYFAQHQLEQLDPQASPLLHLTRLDAKVTEQVGRNFLGGFGFHGDRVHEPVAPFSGGEKSRLVLSLLVWQQPNLLLLDEPTNHLDLEMRHALTVALQDFDGAMVVVSHDRHLLRTCADELYLVHQGRLDLYEGNLDDYRQFLTDTHKEQKKDKEKPKHSKRELRQREAEKRKQLQPLRRELSNLEQNMESLKQEQQEHEKLLSDTTLYTEEKKAELQPLLIRQAELKTQLEDTEWQWLQVSEKIEQAESSID